MHIYENKYKNGFMKLYITLWSIFQTFRISQNFGETVECILQSENAPIIHIFWPGARSILNKSVCNVCVIVEIREFYKVVMAHFSVRPSLFHYIHLSVHCMWYFFWNITHKWQKYRCNEKIKAWLKIVPPQPCWTHRVLKLRKYSSANWFILYWPCIRTKYVGSG